MNEPDGYNFLVKNAQCMSEKERNEEIEKINKVLNDYEMEMYKLKFCPQCAHPTLKGECCCGKYKNSFAKEIYEVFSELERRWRWLYSFALDQEKFEKLSKNLGPLTKKELKTEIKRLENILNKFGNSMKKKGFCQQCSFSWHDGLCECDKREKIGHIDPLPWVLEELVENYKRKLFEMRNIGDLFEN